MTDREMIEQMKNDICNACKPRVAKCKCNFPCSMCGIVATELVKKYQPKVPEDSVVLTKGAYESISSKAKANVVNAVEIRKETVREILDRVDYESGGQTKQITDLLRKQYGVEIKE